MEINYVDNTKTHLVELRLSDFDITALDAERRALPADHLGGAIDTMLNQLFLTVKQNS